jgi:menaquinone-9 beta-reductase
MTAIPRICRPDDSRWDAVVIGAGPSGAMAARELAIGGARVLLVERRDFPREKVCGGCLNGQALGVLQTAGLGTLPERSGGVPLRSFRLGVRGHAVQLDLSAGMVVSRARFDAELVGAAVEAGARFLPRTEARVGGFEASGRTVLLGRDRGEQTIRANVVLVATGLGGSCLPAASAPRTRVARGSRVGTGCFLPDGPADYGAGTIHMAVGKAGYVGLVRLRDGGLHIAGALEPGRWRAVGGPGAVASAVLAEAEFPPIKGLETARWQGTPGLTRRTRPLADVRLFVLGDAAGYVEPFTGEGIAWALASGSAVVPLARAAIERWDSELAGDWQALHRRLIGRRQIFCRAIALGLRRPWLTAIGFEVLLRAPAAAGPAIRRLNAPTSFTTASEPCPS